MDSRRVTVDLEDRIDEIEEQMAELEAQSEEVDQDSAEYVDIAEQYEELEHAVELLEADIERFGGSEFTLKKMKAGEIGQVNDLVLADTVRDDLEDPRTKQSAREMRTIQVGVVDSPPDTPDKPTAFEPPTHKYLYNCIDNLNRFGEVSLDDFSLSSASDDGS